MLFTLELLKAAYGDALLLHFGDPRTPGLAIIDGGPSGIYANVLKPRLNQLMKNKRRLNEGQLPIRLLMLSHFDDDHVNGVLALANDLAETTGQKPYRIDSLWHNCFDDILGGKGDEQAASHTAFVKNFLADESFSKHGSDHPLMLTASVKQGRELRNAAKRLGWDINKEFGGKPVCLPKGGVKTIPLADGLILTPLGPNERELEALHADWNNRIKEIGGAADSVRSAGYDDESVYNLSSITMLAEMTGKDGPPLGMLLTGDARGDRILEGLEAAKLLHNGKIHVDLLKLPHHGSARTVDPAFFKTVTADRYVISSNGEKYDNPDQDTLEWLAAARKGTGPFTLYLTYPVAEFKFNKRAGIQKELQAFIDAGVRSGAYTVVCRKPGALSVCVDLGEPLRE